ncbi:MAG: hypothetical protein JO077_24340 [Verrucomicrobia bacterium]|nr:hypothetical protein [Verrucomicrobiota bacterium]
MNSKQWKHQPSGFAAFDPITDTLLTAYCLLLTAYCLPLTAYRLPLTER